VRRDENGLSVGGAHIGDPVDALAEHRDEVALALVVGDDHRKRDATAAPPTAQLERVQAARRQPRRGDLRPDAVQEPGDTIWAPAAVHQSVEAVGVERARHRTVAEVSLGHMPAKPCPPGCSFAKQEGCYRSVGVAGVIGGADQRGSTAVGSRVTRP
jgi:hypothetical protein